MKLLAKYLRSFYRGATTLVLFLALLSSGLVYAEAPAIYFQAHRGGLDERPENTLAALNYAWKIPGAVPELDVRTTQDGVLVCIHDRTPKRTTDAPLEWAGKNIRAIPYAMLRTWDAGSHFDRAYAGERVPRLDAVLDLLAADPARQLYLDLKDVDNAQVIAMIKAKKVTGQVIFVHGSPAACLVLSTSWPGARTMTWLGGSPEKIPSRFRELAETKFAGIDQIQLHLKPAEAGGPGSYQMGEAFLKEAVATTREMGVTLQVRPFVFDSNSLRALIDAGIHWYVADAPKALRDSIESALRNEE
ncbi:MAG: glycerophosphodiester phosphodiesterase family protein [Candidatus Hydrogenedentes bacterium]|nr:glycerophosphodiester phosphodiesterase family protein [Candidatus Hydrogenedentota bacterium]